MKDWYEILEVSPNASHEVIEKAYKVLAKKYHPDLQQTPQDKKIAEEKMKDLNEAYAILQDEQKKKEYDEKYKRQKEIEKQKERQAIYQESRNIHSSIMPNDKTERYTPPSQPNSVSPEKEKERKKAAREFAKAYNREIKKQMWIQKLKKLASVVILLAVLFIIAFLLWIIPPTHNMLVNFYEENPLIKVLVDAILRVFHS